MASPAGELAEVPPIARVKRSRLAVALAVTVAALPVLVLDNLPSTAQAEQVEVAAVGSAAVGASSSTTSALSSSTTGAPAATVEVTSTEAPTTTAAPPTTQAPTTTVVAVKAAKAPAPAPTTTTTAPPPPPAPKAYGDPEDPATWDRLAQCEADGNWALDSGNGYYGGLQFSPATWEEVGGTGYPHQASREEQIKRGKILQSRYGWGQWPYCSSQLGYR
ncbi:MAG TPA: transglycosylase family protein [Acidimicrobiales bacterium]|nr:transglycosylase family protein [Acidimicrobiales bacterium]